jgi:hypothetical protein
VTSGEKLLIAFGNLSAIIWFIVAPVAYFTGNEWLTFFTLWLASEVLVLTIKVNYLMRVKK